MLGVLRTLMFICFLQPLQTQGVRVFGLQKGLWTVPANNVFLRYNFSKDASLIRELTVCYRVKFESFVITNLHLSYASSQQKPNALAFFNRKDHLRGWFNNKPQTEAQKKLWRGYPDMWHHLCHVFFENTYAIYWQGKEFFNGDLEGGWPLDMNGTLIIGQEQDAISDGFDPTQVLRGEITQIDLWNRRLTQTEAQDLAQCRTEATGNVFTSSSATFEVFGNITETDVPLTQVCSYTPRYVVLPEERSFSESTTLCRLFNTSQAVPKSPSENRLLHEEIIPFLDVCVPSASWKIWIGATDELEDGVWRDDHTQEILTYTNFSALYPISGSLRNCAEMMNDGYWTVDMCELAMKRCSACYVERKDFLRLRGLCFDNDHQSRFRMDGYSDGRPLIRGYYRYIIRWNNAQIKWMLVDTQTNQTIAQLSVADVKAYPIGLKVWDVEKGVCGIAHSGPKTLSLSPCSEGQFMCRSGECIVNSFRCNLRYDCGDGSDEDECRVIVLSGSYGKHLAPTGINGSLLLLKPVVTLTRVASVDEVNQAVTLEFEVSLSWKDPRVSFKYLEVSKKGAVLAKSDMELIWLPTYQVTNLEGGQLKILHETVVVRDANSPTVPDYNAVDMDVTYPGSENEMTVTRRYTAIFTCSFELYSYPFDVQVCSIDLLLPSEYEGYVEFSVEAGDVLYSGQKELALFNVKDIKFSKDSGVDRLRYEFQLNRRQGVILLTTFLPSVLLLSVSWATLFVKLKDLNVRAIMSLTTLLVLYTLFAQLSSSLPSTAAIKLIDIWFFFIIFLLFSNIMVHIFAERLGREETVTTKVEPKNRFQAWQARQPPSERLLLVQRLFIIPGIIVVFNIVFWWQVFSQ